MKELNTEERSSPVAEAIKQQLGEDRLNILQVALATHAEGDTMPSARQLIDGIVDRHLQAGGQDLEELGVSTIADALAEIATSKNAARALMRGKLSVKRAVDAHHQRAAQAAAAQDKATLRELGIAGTSAIYIDAPTDLHLVHLSTPEHCQYEGVSLVHCLGNIATARDYLSRGTLLYSLRKDGIEPRVTIEVDPHRAEVTQARRMHDLPLHEDSGEYQALDRALSPLAAHVATVGEPTLTLIDKVIRR